MQQLATEWPKEDREYFIARARRGMHGYGADSKELIRAYLAHLGVHGDPEGRPITDLRRWAKRQTTSHLRELIVDYGLRLVAERETRFRRPNGPGIVGRREPQKDDRTLEDEERAA